MTYDPSTVLERYRLTAELSADTGHTNCSLLKDGLPPKSREQCSILGCNAGCCGLATIAKAAYERAVAAGVKEPDASYWAAEVAAADPAPDSNRQP